MNLRPWFRPLVVLGATVAAEVVLEVKARDDEATIALELATPQGKVLSGTEQILAGIPFIGPLISGSVGAVVDPKLAAAQADLAIVRLGQALVGLAGGLLFLFFAYRDVFQSAQAKDLEIRRQAAVTQAAVQGAVAGTGAAATGGASLPAVVASHAGDTEHISTSGNQTAERAPGGSIPPPGSPEVPA